jgi:hypothetical protein
MTATAASIPSACPRARPQPSRKETLVGLAVLLCLAAVAAAVVERQFRFNPAVENFLAIASGRSAMGSAGAAPPASDLLVKLPEGLRPLSPIERFDRETLSDKIDGKAELYLSAGFVALESQRFARSAQPDRWIEAFVYDMGSAANAFAVFSSQRRPGVESLEIAQHAYRAENALFFTAGDRYVELIGSENEAPLMEAMLALARVLLDARPATPARADDRDLFPPESLAADTIRLIPQDAFGLAGFDRVYTAAYRQGSAAAIAFLSRRESPQAAQALLAAYAEMLRGFGAAVEAVDRPVAGALAADVLDFQEIVFCQGPFIAGIREAADRGQAAALAAKLSRRLKEAGIDP